VTEPTAAYRKAVAEATAHHAKSKTYSGKFLRPHKPWLLEIIGRHNIGSAIDYGCGKGAQYDWVDPEDGQTLEQAFGFPVYKFDPAWPPFAKEPEAGAKFDLVLCTHVLGSIPLTDLPWVIGRLGDLCARGKVIYVAEKLGPVQKTALSAPEDRPVGWTSAQWRDALGTHLPAHCHAYLSTREAAPEGALTQRWRFGPGKRDWPLVWTSEAGQ
jgi:hypothetical protein